MIPDAEIDSDETHNHDDVDGLGGRDHDDDQCGKEHGLRDAHEYKDFAYTHLLFFLFYTVYVPRKNMKPYFIKMGKCNGSECLSLPEFDRKSG